MPRDTDHDSFAADYARENEASLLNAFYERPAMLELAGATAGRRILDIGCGSGPLMQEFIARGAAVTGFDASRNMIELARDRLGPEADLHVADLGQPLPFADDSFDDAVASLVLHYLEEWVGPLREIRRVLRPGGRLILSVNHPILYPWNHPGKDYFRLARYTDEMDFNGVPASLTYWHRPLHAMSTAFREAGFRIESIAEPPFSKAAPERIVPGNLKDRDAFLSFIFFVLEAP